jgi:hypothetical protein
MKTLLARVEVALGLVLTLVVAALGAQFALSAGGLWRDEVDAVQLAAKPWPDLIAMLDRESSPVLFVTVVKGWSALGWSDGDAALRALGFVLTVALVAVLWISARAVGIRAPVIALSLFAAQGIVIQNVSSGKPYGFSTLPAVGAFAALLVLTVAPSRLAYAVALVLTIVTAQTAYTTLPLVLIIAGIAILMVVWTDRRRAALMAIIPVAAVLSVLPYLGIIKRSGEWRPVTETEITLAALVDMLWRVASTISPLILGVWALAIVGAAFVLARELGAASTGAPWDRRVIAALAGATATFVGFLAFMTLASRPPQPWHWVPALGLVAFGLDAACAKIPRMPWARVSLALLAALVVVPVAVPRVSARQTNVDEIARFLAASADRNDLIVVNPWYVGLTFNRYYRGGAPWTTIPPIDDLTIHRYDLLKQRMMMAAPIDSVHADIVKTLRAGGRVWLVGGLEFIPKGGVPPTMPPAPHGPLGWKDTPYRRVWSAQTGYLVQNVAENWKIVTPASDRPIEGFENAPLIVVDGWRDGFVPPAGAAGRSASR